MTDQLRELWDFDDLDATEQRFRRLLVASGETRAEALTQLARVCGLRGEFATGDELLDQADAEGSNVRTKVLVDLERGRLRRSGGDSPAALPLFESAYAASAAAGEHFLAADAAHMVALASSVTEDFVDWTERGIEIAERHETARYWLGPLLNNLGWEHFEAGGCEDALAAFARALVERERPPRDEQAIAIARYAVAKTLRALDRPAEAAAQLEQAVAWTEVAGRADGWFHEELAEAYAALGRERDAAEQARRALVLLPAADPSFETGSERAARLGSLAASRD
jgi:tetratricopeptide (TPR) repeat protein